MCGVPALLPYSLVVKPSQLSVIYCDFYCPTLLTASAEWQPLGKSKRKKNMENVISTLRLADELRYMGVCISEAAAT